MILLEGINKSYRTRAGRQYLFRDLNFSIPEGRNLGIIGRNGSGKSTLLRIIGGIDKPDRGKVITQGTTISWPIGFRGILQRNITGAENAKLICRFYCTKSQISETMTFIKSFAELDAYFDMPVNTYSVGMRARLAFALSMAFNFDYYVIDEVMAAGDTAFRKKCLKMMRKKRKQAAFILASRNMRKIRKYCDSVLFLGQHEVRYYDQVGPGIKAYRKEEGLGRFANMDESRLPEIGSKSQTASEDDEFYNLDKEVR